MSAVDRGSLAGVTVGSADVVAVEKVLRGVPAELTGADQAYLDTRLTGSWDQAADVARALGITREAVLRRYERVKRRTGTAAP